MQKRNHYSKGSKTHRAYRPPVATVEGEENGVPFRVFMKNMSSAEQLAQRTGGVLQDLYTLRRKQWVDGQWRDV